MRRMHARCRHFTFVKRVGEMYCWEDVVKSKGVKCVAAVHGSESFEDGKMHVHFLVSFPKRTTSKVVRETYPEFGLQYGDVHPVHCKKEFEEYLVKGCDNPEWDVVRYD